MAALALYDDFGFGDRIEDFAIKQFVPPSAFVLKC
jgi:hypothetical protein